jgi:hypothetical protein
VPPPLVRPSKPPVAIPPPSPNAIPAGKPADDQVAVEARGQLYTTHLAADKLLYDEAKSMNKEWAADALEEHEAATMQEVDLHIDVIPPDVDPLFLVLTHNKGFYRQLRKDYRSTLHRIIDSTKTNLAFKARLSVLPKISDLYNLAYAKDPFAAETAKIYVQRHYHLGYRSPPGYSIAKQLRRGAVLCDVREYQIARYQAILDGTSCPEVPPSMATWTEYEWPADKALPDYPQPQPNQRANVPASKRKSRVNTTAAATNVTQLPDLPLTHPAQPARVPRPRVPSTPLQRTTTRPPPVVVPLRKPGVTRERGAQAPVIPAAVALQHRSNVNQVSGRQPAAVLQHNVRTPANPVTPVASAQPLAPASRRRRRSNRLDSDSEDDPVVVPVAPGSFAKDFNEAEEVTEEADDISSGSEDGQDNTDKKNGSIISKPRKKQLQAIFSKIAEWAEEDGMNVNTYINFIFDKGPGAPRKINYFNAFKAYHAVHGVQKQENRMSFFIAISFLTHFINRVASGVQCVFAGDILCYAGETFASGSAGRS